MLLLLLLLRRIWRGWGCFGHCATKASPLSPLFSQARTAVWAEAYLMAAWSQALRGMREDAAQQPRGSSLLPEAQRAVVKMVWTACNDAIYTAQAHPVRSILHAVLDWIFESQLCWLFVILATD